ncbi:MAG: indolepyruvate ferredoxin oxidoreductase subunit alpha [Dehalobacterium sp.]
MKKLMTGNEAIARGAYEAGCILAAAYPGTPSTEILENMAGYPEVYSEWATNEKVALEIACGASIAGARSLAAMKHVGLNVAADPLFTIAYEGVNGGLVIISADDPGMYSSQNEQDNRLYAPHAKIAMVEPSDSKECLEFVKAAFEISEAFDTPVLFRVTTRICHSKSPVEVGDRLEVVVKEYQKNASKYVMIPAFARKRHYDVEERISALQVYSNDCSLNQIEWGDKKIGIITSGISYQHVKEVFGDGASYLKLGFTYPLPDQLIKKFAKMVDRLYVVEENEPYIEDFVKKLGISCAGKEIIPICEELNPQIIRRAFFKAEKKEICDIEVSVPARPPVLCAGCPHRGIFYEISKIKDVVVTSDIGCYTLGMMPPLNVADMVICMGGGISAGLGFQKVFAKTGRGRKIFGLVGDSTFFHSGITGLIDAVYNSSSMVIVILDNSITAMTGHQENPGTGKTLMGAPAPAINIFDVVKAVGIKEENIRVVDPYNLEATKGVVREAYEAVEPFVIITRQPCALIKEVQKIRAKLSCRVDKDKCKKCLACVKLGCPAIKVKDGTAMIDESMCNGCTLCMQVCKFDAIKKVGE